MGVDRLDALTGMRGLASLMVVGYHAVCFFWLWQIETGLAPDAFQHPLSVFALGFGWLGVDFFFVLSGFLLARPLLRQNRMRRQEYRVFAAKRLLRIAPPYYCALLLAYALVGWSDHPLFHFTTEGVVFHVLYLHTFFPSHIIGMLGVAWTLGIELQFYLLLPLLILPFRRYGPAIALALAAAAVAYLAWASTPADDPRSRFLAFQFPAFLGHFGIGIAAAQLVQRDWRPRLQADLAIGAALVLLILLPAWWLGYTRQFEPVDSPLFPFVRLLAAAFFGATIVLALQPGSAVGRVFAVRPMVWVGEASYSLYLVHYSLAGLFLVTRPDWAFASLPWFTILLTAVSLVAAAIFYVLVERPSLQFKEAVARRLGGTPRPRGLDPAP